MTVTALRGACERAGAMTTVGKNRIMIFGPKSDGTYVIEFRTAAGEPLAISIPGTEAAVIRHFQGADAIRTVLAGCGFGCGINPLAV
jgi:FAD/FMN-containing dehydrogenase